MKDLYDECSLTEKQMKAIESVERAIKRAGKLGVNFWDNYGTLTAFNANKITLPTPDPKDQFSLEENDNELLVHALDVQGLFFAGNADDELFFNVVNP